MQPTNPWLLEAMAKDFQEHNYSLHHLIKSIMKSNAYQLSTQFPGEWKDAYAPYYARRFARVITGAEAADTVAQVTGVPYDFNWAGPGMKRVKQLASPIDVNPPQRVGGVNDLGGEGTVEGNSHQGADAVVLPEHARDAGAADQPSQRRAGDADDDGADGRRPRRREAPGAESRLQSLLAVDEDRQRARRGAVPVHPVAPAAARGDAKWRAHPARGRPQAAAPKTSSGRCSTRSSSC